MLKNIFTVVFLLLGFTTFITSANNESNPNILITEVLPNPVGNDIEGEFIEVYNNSNNYIDLNLLTIDNQTIRAFGTEELETIAPHNTLIIHDDNSDIKVKFPGNYTRAVVATTALSNTGDVIQIKYNSTVIDELEYNSSLESVSIVRPFLGCSIFVNHYQNNNSIGQIENENNYVHIEKDPAKCPDITTTPTPTFIPIPTLDPTNIPTPTIVPSITIEPTITLLPSPTTPPSGATPTITPTIFPSPTSATSSSIVINEVYPSPNSGEEEWIEILNFSNSPVIMDNWKLKDNASSQTIDSVALQSSGYYVFKAENLKITPNNSGETIKLFDNSNNLISEFTYPTTPKGKSYGLINNKIVPTKPTEGAANQIETTEGSSGEEEQEIESIPIVEVYDQKELGDLVKIKSTVSFVLANYSNKVFYVQDETAGIKIKVNGNLVKLPAIGNEITLIGTIKQSYGERYLNVTDINSIELKDSSLENELSVISDFDGLENIKGKLVQFDAKVTKVNTKSFDVMANNQIVRIKSENEIKSKVQKETFLKINGILIPNESEESFSVFLIELSEQDDPKIEETIESDKSISENIIQNTAKSSSIAGTSDINYSTAQNYSQNKQADSIKNEIEQTKSNDQTAKDKDKYLPAFFLSIAGIINIPNSKTIILSMFKKLLEKIQS